MKTTKVFTTAGFRRLSTDRPLIYNGKIFHPRRNRGRIREVGLGRRLCLHQGTDGWLGGVKAHRFKYRAYGAFGLLRGYAESLGQRGLSGSKPGLAAPG
jgi:hypothetical protein